MFFLYLNKRDQKTRRRCDVDEIFKDEIIRELYDIKNGSYNCLYGSTELEKKTGTPKVFVAGGGGFGVSVLFHL